MPIPGTDLGAGMLYLRRRERCTVSVRSSGFLGARRARTSRTEPPTRAGCTHMRTASFGARAGNGRPVMAEGLAATGTFEAPCGDTIMYSTSMRLPTLAHYRWHAIYDHFGRACESPNICEDAIRTEDVQVPTASPTPEPAASCPHYDARRSPAVGSDPQCHEDLHDVRTQETP